MPFGDCRFQGGMAFFSVESLQNYVISGKSLLSRVDRVEERGGGGRGSSRGLEELDLASL